MKSLKKLKQLKKRNLILFTVLLLISPMIGISKIPDAAQILDAYVKATGGYDAYDKIQNRLTRSQIEIKDTGITIDMTIYAQKPNLLYAIYNSGLTGKIEMGCDGETVWELSDMKGPIVKSGAERMNLLYLNHLDRYAYWKELYYKTEFIAVDTLDENQCYKIKVIPKIGDSQILYFDCDTHLLLKLDTELQTAMGIIPVVSYFSDYRENDGILLPYKTRIIMMNQEKISTIYGIKNNTDMDKEIFELPSEIQYLIRN